MSMTCQSCSQPLTAENRKRCKGCQSEVCWTCVEHWPQGGPCRRCITRVSKPVATVEIFEVPEVEGLEMNHFCRLTTKHGRQFLRLPPEDSELFGAIDGTPVSEGAAEEMAQWEALIFQSIAIPTTPEGVALAEAQIDESKIELPDALRNPPAFLNSGGA